MCIYIDGDVVCTNQYMSVSGICGVLGKYNQLRDCFISEITGSASKRIPGRSIRMDIEINGELISYEKFKSQLNIYTLFHSKDTVEDILYFVNRNLADNIIEDFLLTNFRKCLIGELTPAISNILEIAVGVCSQSKFFYCYEIIDPFKSTEYYVRQIKKYCNMKDTVIFIETYIFDKFIFDSYLVFEDEMITSFVCEKFNRINIDNFKYKTYTSQFDISQIEYKGEVSEDSSFDKSFCTSSSESIITKKKIVNEKSSFLKIFKDCIIYKKEMFVYFYRLLYFFYLILLKL